LLIWLRIEDDATNVKFHTSSSGERADSRALTRRFDAKDAEAVLRVVEGDALDQAG
jgi:hypothetical protein